MTGLPPKLCLVLFLFLKFTGYLCDGDWFEFNPEGSEFIKQVNESFYIKCSNKSAYNVWWYKNDTKITQNFTRVYVDRSTNTSSAALIFNKIQSSDNGVYTCKGEINNKTESESFTLITFRPITFRDTPTVQESWEGEQGFLKCEADGEPEPVLSWFVDGMKSETYGEKKYKTIGDGLVIPNTTIEDGNRTFICRAAAVNNLTSNIAQRQIKFNVKYAPKLVGNETAEIYGYIGSTVNLSCEVLANPPANFTWYRNNTLFDNDTNATMYFERNKSTLEVAFVDESWYEQYSCIAANERGNVTSFFKLHKVSKPEPPREVKINMTTQNSMVLEIQAPLEKEEEIISYRVQIMEKRDRDLGKGWEVAREVIFPKDKPFIVTDLKSNTEYVFRVTSQNIAGPGEYTSEVKTKTLRASAATNSISTVLLSLVICYCIHNNL